MKAVLAILGIAVAAIGLSIIFSPPKDLTPNPQDRQEERKAQQDKEALERHRNSTAAKSNAPENFEPNREGVINAVVKVAGRGEYAFEMYPKEAPQTVEKFKKLIEAKFFDGMKIHRVEPMFVVQFGDPVYRREAFSDAVLADEKIPFEKNKLMNVKGSLAVALISPQSDTGSSQLFVNLARNIHLDVDYCVFGKVTTGLDVVEKIQKEDMIESITLK